MPYMIIADEAFPLKSYLMRSYSRVFVTGNENIIFYYRLLRARRVVANALKYFLLVEEYFEQSYKCSLSQWIK